MTPPSLPSIVKRHFPYLNVPLSEVDELLAAYGIFYVPVFGHVWVPYRHNYNRDAVHQVHVQHIAFWDRALTLDVQHGKINQKTDRKVI